MDKKQTALPVATAIKKRAVLPRATLYGKQIPPANDQILSFENLISNCLRSSQE